MLYVCLVWDAGTFDSLLGHYIPSSCKIFSLRRLFIVLINVMLVAFGRLLDCNKMEMFFDAQFVLAPLTLAIMDDAQPGYLLDFIH